MHAIYWMLIHSLWQGVLAAVLAGAIITGTRKQPALIRYRLLAADLLLFLLATGFTFCYEIGKGPGANERAAVVRDWRSPEVPTLAGIPGGGANGTGSLSAYAGKISGYAARLADQAARLSDYLNAHAAVVVAIWLSCLFVQLVRLMGGIYGLHLIRNSGVKPGKYWKEELVVLAGRLGIKKSVALLESARVRVPATIGFFKPVILVPLGMLMQLPADQVQTILLHELAHIRRGDYLTNVLLHITTAIFFFNPGIRWLNALIRREREACCDDMVLAHANDRGVYFDALVAFKTFMTGRPAPSYALALGSERNRLLARIRRMLTKENKTLNNMEKTILSFSLAAVITAGLISMRPAPATLVVTGSAVPAMSGSQVPALSGLPATITRADTLPPPPAGRTIAKDTLPNGARTYAKDTLRQRKLEAEAKAEAEHKAEAEYKADAEHKAMSETDTRTMKLQAEEQTQKMRIIADKLQNSDARILRIIEELKRNQLITDEDPLSFTLDNKGLIVNGTAAPAPVYQKLKERFLGSAKGHFIYDHHGGSTHTVISLEN
jgi:beta-lactamase regulating signal transducer with metallopeptidase domain